MQEGIVLILAVSVDWMLVLECSSQRYHLTYQS